MVHGCGPQPALHQRLPAEPPGRRDRDAARPARRSAGESCAGPPPHRARSRLQHAPAAAAGDARHRARHGDLCLPDRDGNRDRPARHGFARRPGRCAHARRHPLGGAPRHREPRRLRPHDRGGRAESRRGPLHHLPAGDAAEHQARHRRSRALRLRHLLRQSGDEPVPGDKSIKFWSLGKTNSMQTIKTEQQLQGVHCKKDGKNIVVSGDDAIYIFERKQNSEWSLLKQIVEQKGYIYKVVYSQNDKYIISASSGNNIIFWDSTSFQKIKEIGDQPLKYKSIDSFGSSDFLITQNQNDKKLILWRTSTQQPVWKSDPLEYQSFSIKVIEEERKILIGLEGGKTTIIKY